VPRAADHIITGVYTHSTAFSDVFIYRARCFLNYRADCQRALFVSRRHSWPGCPVKPASIARDHFWPLPCGLRRLAVAKEYIGPLAMDTIDVSSRPKVAPWVLGLLMCVAGCAYVSRGVLQVVDLRQRGVRTQAVIVATDYVRDSDGDTRVEQPTNSKRPESHSRASTRPRDKAFSMAHPCWCVTCRINLPLRNLKSTCLTQQTYMQASALSHALVLVRLFVL